MSDELRTDFTKAERDAIIWGLRDEYGDNEFSEELILLECQDLWRKGCHNLENGTECHGCGPNGECGLHNWEKRHPEYKDDELAKRLEMLRNEVRGMQKAKIDAKLAEERKTYGIRLPHSFVTNEQIAKAKQVLIDRGIAPVVVDDVLQAIGHALLDVELVN